MKCDVWCEVGGRSSGGGGNDAGTKGWVGNWLEGRDGEMWWDDCVWEDSGQGNCFVFVLFIYFYLCFLLQHYLLNK